MRDQPLDGMGIDLGRVQPGAREIARQVAEVYAHHLGPDLVSLVVHGSGVKGGLIAGSSDLDFAALVRPEALTPCRELPFDRVIALHRDLARIDPAPFRYIQGYMDALGARHGVGFIPGTFQVLYGSAAVPLATGDALVESARSALHALDSAAIRDRLSNALLDHGEERLARQVRFMCTDVWPTMYQVACLREPDPIRIWQLTKPEVVALLSDDPVVGPPLRRWWAVITTHYATGEPVDTALEALVSGVAFLEAAAIWAGDDLTPSAHR